MAPRENLVKIKFINDVIDVFVKHAKKLSDFPPETQQRMRDYYRFMPNWYGSNEDYYTVKSRGVHMTADTLDII